eukprot:Em0008g133a
MLPRVYGDEITEPTIVADCGRSGPVRLLSRAAGAIQFNSTCFQFTYTSYFAYVFQFTYTAYTGQNGQTNIFNVVPSSIPNHQVTLPSLEDICSLKHPTIRFIPSSARPAFARVLSSVLKEIVAVNSVAAWTKLLMLPKCVLPTSKRGGRHNKPISIDILCDMWLKGNLCELWLRAQTQATISTQSKKVLPNKRVDSAIALAKDGLYSKACQMLTSQGLAPDDDNTWNLLISKHPQGECPSNLPIPSTETVLPHDFNIVPVLRSFSKLTGAGPTVSEIVLEPGCANLLYHAWYLDDGVVAGSSTEPNIEILGIPIGDLDFCTTFISHKHVAFANYLIWLATPPSLSVKALELFDQDVRSCLSQSTSVDLTDVSWNQAQLSLSRGGLGMRSLMLHAPAAYIASVCSSGYGLQSLTHLTHAVEMFNVCVAPADKISLDSLASSNINQKMLSSKLDDYQLQGIFNRSSVADRARLLSISAPHSSSWLSVVPSEGLGLHFEPNQYNVALKWWLGLDTSCGSCCAFCPDSILDPLGHHASTCKRGGDAITCCEMCLQIPAAWLTFLSSSK